MVPGYCGVTGVAGLLIMGLLWVALLLTVIWGIRRLFPDRSPPMDPVPPARGEHQA